ncbi:cupin domain-containing protein [Pseudomonas sp. LS1212]|uniref:cupin domain-containing protein n=1 Tax=Pseudomonas sp. LS1212 TaxID=2972478 RepID=UPI00215CA62D|nr:cupin domain-containing protein [Pseudomonas sp. LS1212]UVJ44339.1 cupin domain-containing protein [Pseudomonas sp. LS1212]
MNLTRTFASTLLCSVCLLFGTGAHAYEQSAIESQIVLRSSSSWDGTPYTAYPAGRPELTLVKIRIPANAEMQWHTHPIPNMGYVLSGEILVEARDSNQRKSLKQGDALAEMVDIVHRGKTGEHPVELIVFYAGAHGLPLSE